MIWKECPFEEMKKPATGDPDPDAGSITEWVGDLEPKLGPHAVDK